MTMVPFAMPRIYSAKHSMRSRKKVDGKKWMVFFYPVKVGAIKEEKVVQLQKRLCCPGSAQNEPPTN
jgi:hypothetical protein